MCLNITNHFECQCDFNTLTQNISELDKLRDIKFNLNARTPLQNPTDQNLRDSEQGIHRNRQRKRRKRLSRRECQIVFHGIHQNDAEWKSRNLESRAEGETFLREKLKLHNIVIKSATLLGKNKDNIPLLITLYNNSDKQKIFSSVHHLKSLHNSGQKYSVQEYLNKSDQKTFKILSKTFKYNQILGNKVKFKQKKLFINGREYKSNEESNACDEDYTVLTLNETIPLFSDRGQLKENNLFPSNFSHDAKTLQQNEQESTSRTQPVSISSTKLHKRKIPLQRPPFPPPRPPLPLFSRTPSLISSKTNAEISSNTSDFSDNLSISSSKKSFSLKKTFNSFTRRNK